MNINKMKNLLIVLIILVLLLFSITFVCLKYKHFENNKKESFISGFRQMYRPKIRSIRLVSENYYNNIKNTTLIFFKKFGLI